MEPQLQIIFPWISLNFFHDANEQQVPGTGTVGLLAYNALQSKSYKHAQCQAPSPLHSTHKTWEMYVCANSPLPNFSLDFFLHHFAFNRSENRLFLWRWHLKINKFSYKQLSSLNISLLILTHYSNFKFSLLTSTAKCITGYVTGCT